MSELERKIVLITGATGGLGYEMTRAFLDKGSNLILTDLYESSLAKIVNEFSNPPKGKILGTIGLDLTEESSLPDLHKFVKSFQSSGPDILVNNAGIASFGKFFETPKEKWEKILNLNLLAPMRITYELLPGMIKRRSGHIVNVSSVAGLIATPGLVAYSTSKFGIKAFGEALQKDVQEFGIQVTNLYPFFTKTAILDSEQFGVKDKKKIPDAILSQPSDVIEELIRGIEQNRLHVYPGHIAKSIEFFGKFAPWIFQDLAKGVLH